MVKVSPGLVRPIRLVDDPSSRLPSCQVYQSQHNLCSEIIIKFLDVYYLLHLLCLRCAATHIKVKLRRSKAVKAQTLRLLVIPKFYFSFNW